MPMTGKEMVKLLKKHGWEIRHNRGGHTSMVKDGKTIPIPNHGSKELKKGTELAILRQAGLR